MTEPQPGVSAPVALAFGTVGFFALVVAGFGLLSLATGDEVLPVTGLGPLPGIAAVVFAVAAFVLTVWAVVRRPAPRWDVDLTPCAGSSSTRGSRPPAVSTACASDPASATGGS